MSNMTSKLVNSVRQAKDKKIDEDDSSKNPTKATQPQTKTKAKPVTKKAKTKAPARAKTSTRKKAQPKKLNIIADPFSFERVWPD